MRRFVNRVKSLGNTFLLKFMAQKMKKSSLKELMENVISALCIEKEIMNSKTLFR